MNVERCSLIINTQNHLADLTFKLLKESQNAKRLPQISKAILQYSHQKEAQAQYSYR